jgi:hypothetical protein
MSFETLAARAICSPNLPDTALIEAVKRNPQQFQVVQQTFHELKKLFGNDISNTDLAKLVIAAGNITYRGATTPKLAILKEILTK